jgi:NAD(P)-dependent dehydrogenase (short-subunit alcohol dehydrogenase family)
MNNVLPGFVDSLPETEARRQRIPMGRYARISEVTALVVWLASPESSRVTGQNIRVDGDLARRV